MTPKQLAEITGFKVLTGDGSTTVNSVYCCDLLSIVMGKLPSEGVWVTVMGNRNSIAVAVLAECGCIVLADGRTLDDDAREKAEEENISVLSTDFPVFEAAKLTDQVLTDSCINNSDCKYNNDNTGNGSRTENSNSSGNGNDYADGNNSCTASMALIE